MHRIDTPGHVSNRFSVGSPQTGQKPTRLGQDWPNAIQEELAHLVEYAGLVLAKADTTQVRQAIVALIAGIVGTGGGSVPTTRQVTGSGLVTGGGNLAVDRVLNVAPASAPDILAGLRHDVAITPLGLASAFASSLGPNGFYRLAGGLIMQWGAVRGVYGEGVVTVTLPTAFPNNFASCVLSQHNPTGATGSGNDMWEQISTKSLVNFLAVNQSTTANNAYGFDWFAIGY